ncbi:helix-turn-helix domain-containing protein [Pseudovibrio ascidiaceicola]|uniref:helix-turn-helix domain-containing protein n=1 Tax=Pseudovibrio ascidiaceicola TaxID=285279 RepID=UPI003D36A9F7
MRMGRTTIAKTELGQRLTEIRGDEKRVDFCARIGVSENTYRNYERGTRLPDTDVLAKIAEANCINLHWLILGEGSMRLGEIEAPQTAAIETEFFVAVQETIRKTYKEVGARIYDADLARFSAEKYEEYIALADDPKDQKECDELMRDLRRRLKKQLTTASPDQAQSKRQA